MRPTQCPMWGDDTDLRRAQLLDFGAARKERIAEERAARTWEYEPWSGTLARIDAIPALTPHAGAGGYEPGSASPRGLSERAVNRLAIALLLAVFSAAVGAAWMAGTGRLPWQ